MILGVFEIILLTIGLVCIYYSWKFKKILNSENNSQFMVKEASRIVFEDAKVDESYSSEGRVYCTGISLIKNEQTGKYNLIPQAKVCDIGLY